MARQLERDYEGERNELLQKAYEERIRGREGSALCLELIAEHFQNIINEKYLKQFQK